jgi:antitoxin VapB
MALNIKNQDVETLLDSVVKMTGESKTEAVRKALEERHHKLALSSMTSHDHNRVNNFLAEEIWTQIPPDLLGSTLSKEEEEKILGLGELGV